MKENILKDMDWNKDDVVFLFVIMFCLVSFFLYAFGLALVEYPLITGVSSLTFIFIIIFVWMLNKYFKIKKLEAQPDAIEILNQKYADGELTDEELAEKTEKILENK